MWNNGKGLILRNKALERVRQSDEDDEKWWGMTLRDEASWCESDDGWSVVGTVERSERVIKSDKNQWVRIEVIEV